jgi:site-specific recombinase XerD
MDMAYLFYDAGAVRVPFTDFDVRLHQRFSNSSFGVWDGKLRQYIIKFPQNLSPDLKPHFTLPLQRLFYDLPYVEVGKNPEYPVLVTGFFERPWPSFEPNASPEERRAIACAPRRAVRTLNDEQCLEESLSPPDQFSGFWRKNLETELRSRKYSPKTMRSYIHYNRALCRKLQKQPEAVTPADIKGYLAYLDKDLDLSTSSMNLAISAFKFFYSNVLKKDITRDQHRPRHDKRLPTVLAKSEVKLLLDCEKNPKHRLLLMLAYSSGLRVSEVIALRREHLDPNRKTILVHSGKGRKDRYTLLSDRAAAFIKDYCALYDIDGWLFPGQPASGHLSVRAAQKVFEKALAKAGIQKAGVSIHSLRHTFATHLMENGTDIKYIQALLGHSSIRTTSRYTHVARRDVLRIQSPLDSPDI